MNRYDHILWDWNGTLLDDLALNLSVENTLLTRRGLSTIGSKDFYLEHFAFPVRKFYEMVGFDFSKEDFTAVSDEYVELYEAGLHMAALFDDVVPALEVLERRGVRQGIISASEHARLTEEVRSFGIADRFICILGSENNLGRSKVHVALDWLKQSGIDPRRMAFVGDTIHDRETADALGCDCFFVARGHNARHRLEATGCPVFDSIKDLCERLCDA
ncbi:MAG: HAD family hydrolase [Clostridia bacterium]|nr:HAD family hydrolase [Clostridia bacterium]